MEKFAGDSYTQHNPEVADGKEGFIAYFERMERDGHTASGKPPTRPKTSFRADGTSQGAWEGVPRDTGGQLADG